MMTLIILIVVIVVGGYLTTKWDYELIGWFMAVFASIYLIIHLLTWGLTSYDYGMFVEKRNSFEQTLQESRDNGNKFETAAIVKEVAEWNVKLAEYKYNNKTLFFDQYIDDRIELLEPIK